MEHYGVISLIPALSVLVLALVTKRTLEALIGGTLVGFVIWKKDDFFSGFSDAALKVMGDPTIGWIILVCGLFGSLIALLVKSGGALAFGSFIVRFVKSRRSALFATWILGLVIFIDDYLNALTVSSAMKKVTDRFKISREMLAYVVDSTAAPVCVLLPFSTWAIFVAGLLESTGASGQGEGLSLYVSTIPCMIYAWVAVLLVPLVSLGVIPNLGQMKKAELNALNGNPDNLTESLQSGGLDQDLHFSDGEVPLSGDIASKALECPKLYNFLIPIAVLIFFTVYFDIDAFKGVLIATTVAIILFAVQKLMSLNELFDTCISGFTTMIPPLAIVVTSFMLKEVNDGLGLTNYIIETVKPFMGPALLPAVAFVSLSLVTFATGSFWGVYAVALPIVVPLAQSIGVSMPLAIGAVISAGAFGSHACFYGDATVLSATGSGCSPMAHALTQLPYAVLSAGLTTLFFIIAGVVMS
ncbi:Na+/H+ antiporter NhaC family protein [Desulforhopalus singaporensis]|uniref:Transporter, NhaC family n=1 Tax=Desulforhopalus singaporensis TaxID=91360 RepID=A0A1H0TIE3_9BACT|nr:Na+/H+ antiporter NhaC family protein [Desulforhopalus singaporensis]SDP53822.1 transporter, NhaC family [Desulforhopalus singaporensis]